MPNLNSPLSIYIHIPFCSTRCSYCAFNTYTELEDLIPSYVQALCEELKAIAATCPHELVHTIYFGGGTPSLLRPQQLDQVLQLLVRLFPVSDDAELSLEANPDDLSHSYLSELRRIGFNRLSIGMQSANARILRLFDRQHELQTVADAVGNARKAQFNNINLDIIFGSPYETLAEWKHTVDTVIQFMPDHISMYGLELKGGTKLRSLVDGGELPQPDDDDFADMYELASGRLADQGYQQYEISNWCRPRRECRHNLQYWRNLEYVGLGAGAHGFAKGCRYTTIAAPDRYIAALTSREFAPAAFPLSPAAAKTTEVTVAEDLYETIMMSLRLTREGIDRQSFQKRFGRDPVQMFPAAVEKLESLGLLLVDQARLRISDTGRLLSNAVIREFLEEIKIHD